MHRLRVANVSGRKARESAEARTEVALDAATSMGVDNGQGSRVRDGDCRRREPESADVDLPHADRKSVV